MLSVLLIPVYIGFLGVEAYGLVGFFLTLISIIGILDLGLGNTITRELARSGVSKTNDYPPRDLVRSFEYIYWSMAILAGVVIVGISGYLSTNWIKAEQLEIESVRQAIILMGTAIAFRFPMALYQGGLMGLQKQVLVNKILVISGTLRGGGAVLVLSLISPTIEAFFVWQVIMSCFTTFTFMIFLWGQLPKQSHKAMFNMVVIKGVWKYAAAVSLNAVVGVVLSQLDKVILSSMLTLQMFAYYTIATTVAASIWILILPFGNALFPKLVELFEFKKDAELKILFHRSSQSMTLILAPLCAVIIFFAPDILMIWLNDQSVVDNTHLIVSLLVVGTMLNGLVSLPVYAASAFGWPMLITRTNLVQMVIILPLIYILSSKYGGVGAAIAWIVLNSSYMFYAVPRFFTKYLTSERKEWFLRDMLLPTIIAFVICGVASLLYSGYNNQFYRIVWLTFVTLITFLGAGLVLPFFRFELMKFLMKRIKTK